MKSASLNHIYRLVWSQVLNAWVAVAENVKGRGKSSSRKLVAAALALTAGAFLSPFAMAGPGGGQVVSGAGSISQQGATTTIQQTSQNLSLNWQSFNIAKQETVNFLQPSATAIAVNRIFDTNGTQILGHLNANGQIYLINPNGIIFGQGAQVNVGGLVASTLDIANSANGVVSFSGNGAGSIVNQGVINAAKGGYVAFIGNAVSNTGAIIAPMGAVGLGAGNAVTLTFAGNSLLKMQVEQSVLNALAANGGLIQADGDMVILTAGARTALLASVVNNTGIIEARTVEKHNGTITLLGGMSAGTVNVAGTLDASALPLLPSPFSLPAANGGFIETSAHNVHVAPDANISTAAAQGLNGTWLIDPVDFTIAATGGDITGTLLGTMLGTSSVTIQTATGSNTASNLYANGATGTGNINVNDTVSWSANSTLTLSALNNININSSITSSGSTGKLALLYGQGAATSGNTAAYNINAPVNLIAGNNFSTTLGNTSGATVNYTVITSLGAAADATNAPATMTLQGMAATTSLAGNFVLGANIDATSTSGWNFVSGTTYAGFTPIGNSSAAFIGTFDGLGHSISNLTINLPATDYVGLFGRLYGLSPMVQNVGLIGGSVIGRNYVGELVGLINLSTVKNSYTTGSVSGSSQVGGLLGVNNGTISNNYATGNVNASGIGYVGGLVGFSQSSSISNCYATGSVTGSGDIGGLVGSNGGTINYSYATGSVSGSTDVGGLVGYINSSQSVISNSYATGLVSGTSSLGGLVGYSSSGAISSSYWNITTSGQATSAGGTGLTTAQMQTATNFTGFNFTTTPSATGNNWVMVDADGTLNNTGGATGATFPMLASEYSTTINSGHQLQLMAMNLAGSYTLGSNIDASNTATATTLKDIWSTAGGFVPIGNSTSNFTGTFDGLGHTISNLTINLPAILYVGLFGYDNATSVIRNVGMIGGSTTGSGSVGGLVGFNNGTISNSYATDNVFSTSSLNYIGGLVGLNYGTISNSYATGNVSSSSATYVGGLTGFNSGIINNSYATGNVTGSSYVGGLVGSNIGSISNTYATGWVHGNSYVGSLVGYNTSTISNSFYETVVANHALTGIGSSSSQNNAASSVAGTADIARTVYGMSATDMKLQANFTSSTSANGNMNPAWDFTTTPIWGYVTGNNSGLPVLCVFGGCAPLPPTTPIYLDLLAGSSVYGSAPAFTYGYYTTATYGSGTLIDNATVAATGTPGSTGAPTSASGINAYTVTPVISGITGINNAYTLSAGNAASWTVTARPVTLTGSTTYNGSASIAGSLLSLSNAVNSDSVTVAGTATLASKNAGSENISSLAGLTLNNTNYTITGGSGTVAVAQAALTISATADSKTYNGNTTSTATPTLSAGQIFSGDSLSGVAQSFNSKNVMGTGGSTLSVTAYNLSDGNNGGNYTVTTGTATGTITPAALAVNAVTDSKTYNGSTASSGAVSVGTLYSTDTVTGTSQAFTSKDVKGANGSTLAVTGYTVNDGNSGNDYTVTTGTATGTINPAVLTVTANAASRPYGAANPVFGETISGFVNGETASVVTGTATGSSAAIATTGAGTSAIIASNNGLSASNYVFSNLVNGTLTITQAPLSVSGLSGTGRAYNGTIVDALSGTATLIGLQNGETLMVDGTSNGTLGSANAGSQTVATAITIANNGSFLASNYALTQPTLANVSITQAPLVYTANPASFFTGQTATGLTGTISGFIGGDRQGSATSGSLSWLTTAGVASQPGVYAINGAGLSAINYSFMQNLSNMTALTLKPGTLPAEVQNVTTQFSSNAGGQSLAGQSANNLSASSSGISGASTTITLLPDTTSGRGVNTGSGEVAGGASASGGNGGSFNFITYAIGGTGTLQIVNGGIRMPDNLGSNQ